jgi:hypothetical protein
MAAEEDPRSAGMAPVLGTNAPKASSEEVKRIEEMLEVCLAVEGEAPIESDHLVEA